MSKAQYEKRVKEFKAAIQKAINRGNENAAEMLMEGLMEFQYEYDAADEN